MVGATVGSPVSLLSPVEPLVDHIEISLENKSCLELFLHFLFCNFMEQLWQWSGPIWWHLYTAFSAGLLFFNYKKCKYCSAQLMPYVKCLVHYDLPVVSKKMFEQLLLNTEQLTAINLINIKAPVDGYF